MLASIALGSTHAAEAVADELAIGQVSRPRQGWDREVRRRFYFTSQGSRLFPYRWFLALEQPDSEEPVRSADNLRRLRFVSDEVRDPELNPDDLPIGFVKDSGPAMPPPDPLVLESLKIGEVVDRSAFPKATEWLGFNCAACHTTRIDAGGRTLRIDGGPAMADVQAFLFQLNEAAIATARDEGKRDRFARAVLGAGHDAEARATLLRELELYGKLFDALVRRNSEPPRPRYGFARLDAFGAIFNQVCSYGLGIPENHRPSDAPVSYPQLWDTPALDWVQWNGSAGNPIARNVGQVLGVFADFRLARPAGSPADPERFRSSVKLEALADMERWLRDLEAPAWPEHLGGDFLIDRELVAKGEVLYRANCAGCHALRGPDGHFPQTEGLALQGSNRTFIRTVMIPAAEIGTDPQFLLNFKAMAKPGSFAGVRGIPVDAAEVPRPTLLGIAVGGIIERKLKESKIAPGSEKFNEMNGYRNPNILPPNPGAYKARPLNGIWATGPFLHNGSVPNLDELLKPADQRVKTFRVGRWQFDPRRVGYRSGRDRGRRTFEFRVLDGAGRPIPGNSNAGHSGPGYTKTKGARPRDFTPAERRQLLEFIKTIK